MAGPVHHARQQREAREWVASQRGHSFFKYGYSDETKWYVTDSELAVPTVATQLFGIDVFNPVTGVLFDCDELQTVEPLTGIHTLESVTVNIEMAEDIDFRPLKELPRLPRLHFTKWAFLTRDQSMSLRKMLPGVEITAEY